MTESRDVYNALTDDLSTVGRINSDRQHNTMLHTVIV